MKQETRDWIAVAQLAVLTPFEPRNAALGGLKQTATGAQGGRLPR